MNTAQRVALATAASALLLLAWSHDWVVTDEGLPPPRDEPPTAPRDPGHLTLDPGSVFFSLPTICDSLPPTAPETAEPAASHLRLRDDAWRNLEFVATRHRDSVAAELATLREFERANRAGPGWKDIHVRTTRPDALAPEKISLERLHGLLGTDSIRSKLFLDSDWGLLSVRDGFAVRLDDHATLYGHADGAHIASLGLECADPSKLTPATRAVLGKILRELDVCLVDWCRTQVIDP